MSEHETNVLVIGGGISGLTTAVEAAEAGYTATILENTPYLGGRVGKMNKYFPKLCPPICGLEINYRRIKFSPDVTFYTLANVESITGQAGNYEVTVKLSPRYVNDKCTGCNACTEACPIEVPNDFNAGLDKRKAAYIPHQQAFPLQYVIDEAACKKGDCSKCADACKYDAIDLKMPPETLKIKAGSIVLATGWKPYDAKKIDNLGFGTSPNIITNVMMERIASGNGPTQGKITRPSDGKEAKRVAFVQCAGSRDENHLAFCSAVCCLASLKQATYVRDQYPDSEVQMFYIDIRHGDQIDRNGIKIFQFLETVQGFKGLIKGNPLEGLRILRPDRIDEDCGARREISETARLDQERGPFGVGDTKAGQRAPSNQVGVLNLRLEGPEIVLIEELGDLAGSCPVHGEG